MLQTHLVYFLPQFWNQSSAQSGEGRGVGKVCVCLVVEWATTELARETA